MLKSRLYVIILQACALVYQHYTKHVGNDNKQMLACPTLNTWGMITNKCEPAHVAM